MTGCTGRGYFGWRSRQRNEAPLLVPLPYPRNKPSCNPSQTPNGGAVHPVAPHPAQRPHARARVARHAGALARPTPLGAGRVYGQPTADGGSIRLQGVLKWRGRRRTCDIGNQEEA